MVEGAGTIGPGSSKEELFAALEKARATVDQLIIDKQGLEIMLETATQHADHMSESLAVERDDLATMLEMHSEHADTVEEELHERAADAIRRSEQQLRTIVEATPAAVVISRVSDGEMFYANVMMGELFQISAKDLVGLKLADFYFDPIDRGALVKTLTVEGFVDSQEIRFKRPNGSLVWVEISLRHLEFHNEPAILSALHDITERKEDELRLQKQVEELRLELEDASHSSELAGGTGTTRFQNLDAAAIEEGTTHLIAVHSYRGGNGKSSIVANLAGIVAAEGQRVGVIDASLQSPGLHTLLGRSLGKDDQTLNDYLLGNCSIHQLAIDMTSELGAAVAGKLFLIPASADPGAIAQVVSQGYEAQKLTKCFQEIAMLLQLDVLLIDTHAGLNEEALLAMQSVSTMLIVMRPDANDFEGTGVILQVARKLDVPRPLLIINQLLDTSQVLAVRTRAEKTFGTEVAAVLPYSPEFMTFDGNSLFIFKHAEHPISLSLKQMATSFVTALR